MTAHSDFTHYDGIGMAGLVRRNEVTPQELVEEAIARIEALNPSINAVIQPMYDEARTTAAADLPDGPFRGVPFLLKDLLVHHAGVPTRNGSRFHHDDVPNHDSELVRRFKNAGLIILGKTNTSEYGLLPVTEPAAFGATNNPWDLTRTTGGSSGGAAAAVAAGMVPLAHGSDGGGSIRIPASCCGLFGLKPTRGRVPSEPAVEEVWHGLISDHVLTRSVRDSAAILDVTAGTATGARYTTPNPPRPFLDEVGRDPGRLRVAFTSTLLLPVPVHPDCLKGLEATISLCENLGHQVEESAPQLDGEAIIRSFLVLLWAGTRTGIEEAQAALGRKATAKDFELETWAAGLLGHRITAPMLSRAILNLQRTALQVARFFDDYDVLITPTLAAPPLLTGAIRATGAEAAAARLLGRLNAGRTLWRLAAEAPAVDSKIFQFTPYTTLFNITGHPAMSVPLHWSPDELPIGIHFVGRYGDEATLFRLAGQLEQAAPWFDHTAPALRPSVTENQGVATDQRRLVPRPSEGTPQTLAGGPELPASQPRFDSDGMAYPRPHVRGSSPIQPQR